MPGPRDNVTVRGPTRSDDLTLTDYFWRHTLSALLNNLPCPRLEFYEANESACRYCLQADEDTRDFFLVDYDEVAESGRSSSRGFTELLEDPDSRATTGHVFALSLPGQRDSIDRAVELVVRLRAAVSVGVRAIILRPTISYDDYEYECDRHYFDVERRLGETPHERVKKSKRASEMECTGHHVLTLLRVLHWKLLSHNNK